MSSVSTAFKVHYNQIFFGGGPIRPSWGGRTMASGGGIDAPVIPSLVTIGPGSTKLRRVEFWLAP